MHSIALDGIVRWWACFIQIVCFLWLGRDRVGLGVLGARSWMDGWMDAMATVWVSPHTLGGGVFGVGREVEMR